MDPGSTRWSAVVVFAMLTVGTMYVVAPGSSPAVGATSRVNARANARHHPARDLRTVKPPTRPVAESGTRHSLTLRWTRSSTHGARFVVIRRAQGRHAPATPHTGKAVATVPRRRTSVTDNGLRPGTPYSYALFARNRSGTYSRPRRLTTATLRRTWFHSDVDPPSGGGLTAVSCVPSGFCVAGDQSGDVLTYNGSSWSQPVRISRGDLPEITRISCASSVFCIAAFQAAAGGPGGDWIPKVSTWNGSTWSAPTGLVAQATGRVSALTCAPNSTTCLAGADGAVMSYADGVWTSVAPLAGIAVTSLSCSDPTFCVALTGTGAFTYSAGNWSGFHSLDPTGSLADVSCAAVADCIAIGPSVSFHLQGTWSQTASTPGFSYPPVGLSCPATTSCLAVDQAGVTARFDGTSWTAVAVPSGPTTTRVTDLACVSEVRCLVTGEVSRVFTSDPATPAGLVFVWDGASWTTDLDVDPDRGYLMGVSCPTRRFCMAVDQSGNVVEYDGSSWGRPHLLDSRLHSSAAISCVSADFCAVIFGDGHASTYDGQSWTDLVPADPRATGDVFRFGPPGAQHLECLSKSFCMATDWNHSVTYDGSSWSSVRPIPPGIPDPRHPDRPIALAGMDCVTRSFCAALVAPRSVVTYNGTRWSKLTHIPGEGYLNAVSCPRRHHCLAVGGPQSATYDGRHWSAVSPISNRRRYDKQASLVAISCASSEKCTAVDMGGDVLEYHHLVWSAPLLVDRSGLFGSVPVSRLVVDLSCPDPGWCRAAGGRTVLGTGR